MSKPRLRLQRANYMVADLDRALTFYRDVLGFDVVFIKESETTSYSYDVFEIPRDQPLRFCVLGTPEQPNVLALTEVPTITPLTDMPRRSAAVIECRDFDQVVEDSRTLGLKVYPEDKLITKDGREGREVGIVDFDGNLIAAYLIMKAAPQESIK